jgi:hypothetical protein
MQSWSACGRNNVHNSSNLPSNNISFKDEAFACSYIHCIETKLSIRVASVARKLAAICSKKNTLSSFSGNIAMELGVEIKCLETTPLSCDILQIDELASLWGIFFTFARDMGLSFASIIR